MLKEAIMRSQILINCGNNWFEFTKSKTGQIDYLGKNDKVNPAELEGYQKIASSTYFTPSWYTYLQTEINNNPKLYVAQGIDISDKDTYSFLVHIGALLSAIEAKDSLLAGELYLRRQSSFEDFAQLTQYIMEPLCVEILFSLCYGKLNNVDPDSVPLIFNNAKKKLNYDSSKETLNQAFIRYFKNNNVTVTLPIVGTNFYHWDSIPDVLDKLTDNLSCDDFVSASTKIRKATHDFYENLEVFVQAEPYNQHDKNAILVCIENIEAKIVGNPGLEKVGHIRAFAAEIIREAKQEKMNYNGKLCRLSYGEIVVQFTV